MRISGLDRQLLLGVVSGTIATLPMSAFMLLAQRAGWLTEQAPERITELTIERVTNRDAQGGSLDAWTAVAHLTFGAAAGAVFAVLLAERPLRAATVAPWGAGFGTLVWLVSYWSVLPALDLMPPPPHDQRRRPQVMLVAHWIYGGVLGLLAARRVR